MFLILTKYSQGILPATSFKAVWECSACVHMEHSGAAPQLWVPQSSAVRIDGLLIYPHSWRPQKDKPAFKNIKGQSRI